MPFEEVKRNELEWKGMFKFQGQSGSILEEDIPWRVFIPGNQ
jgi:hypothetical protein